MFSAVRPQVVARTTRGMRLLPGAAAVLVLIAGIQLFVLADYTDHFFAWTINPPITAAFLGAGYWSSLTLEGLAARRPEWARMRISVPTAFVFTIFTLVLTLLHLDKFHLGSGDFNAQLAAWAWLIVYAGGPFAILVLILQQLRVPGGDPPRLAPMSSFLRWALTVQGSIMAILGLFLFVLPQVIAPMWPWALTPLTGRAIGAWFLGLSVAAFHAVWERDLERILPGAASFSIFGLLQLVVLVRFNDLVRWGEVGTLLYVALCLSMLVVGLVGVLSVRQSSRSNIEVLEGEAS